MADNKKNKRNNRNNNQDDNYNPKFRKMRKKVCPLCADKNLVLDYKNADQLKKFINDKGKILPRRASKRYYYSCKKSKTNCNLTIHSRIVKIYGKSQVMLRLFDSFCFNKFQPYFL